jgi:hypothetical protein
MTDRPEAQLPVAYSAAKAALAKCIDIDECAMWANKAAAFEAYARQAGDDELMNNSRRIKARAVDRMGEVAAEIPAQPGKRTDREPGVGGGPRLSPRAKVASDAGVSDRQLKTALRVHNVPREDFERQVESAHPPTITKLARQGTRSVHHKTTAPPGKSEPDAVSFLESVVQDIERIEKDCHRFPALKRAITNARRTAVKQKELALLDRAIAEGKRRART